MQTAKDVHACTAPFLSCCVPGIKVVFGKKPLEGVKKIGLSIGQESLARIMGNWKHGKILEDGTCHLYFTYSVEQLLFVFSFPYPNSF
jgi:hypothetical protein